MIVSLEEAFGLFSKWKSESTPILGVLAMDGAGVTFSGVITGLEPHALVVSQYPKPDWMVMEVLVGLDGVKTYDYRDLREAPANIREKFKGKISSLLAVELSTSTLLLYETEQPPRG